MCPNELQSLIDQDVVKRVPPEHCKNKVRWGHPDGYFMNAKGKRLSENFPPSQYVHRGGSAYPKFRKDCNHLACHVAMALAFYGERKTYINKKGLVKPYQAHHLNGDKFDYRPANILAWLHPDEHRIADARQKTLKTVVPEGNLKGFDYAILRELEDPRTMADDDFKTRMEYLRVMCECGFDPRIFAAKQLHYWFSMPFEEFKTFFYHYKND